MSHLLIISDANNLLLIVDLSGQVLDTYALPGKKQEGVTLTDEQVLIIAEDTKEALLQFRPVNTTDPK